MTPVLVTAPETLPVSILEMKEHLRVDSNDEDLLINGLLTAAVAYLDGWRGVLGRCIVSQVWSIPADAAGDYALPMIDVIGATQGGVALTISQTRCVTVSAAGAIEFTCEMPAQDLALAKVAILLLVSHWFSNREAVGQPMAEMPLAVGSIIDVMRRVTF